MSIYLNVKKSLEYIIEAVLKVFSPNHDNYPAIGIQPFGGEIYLEEK